MTAAERMRAARARRAEGYRLVSLEIHRSQIAALIDRRLLNPDRSDDRFEIACALARLLEQTFESIDPS